MVVIINTDKYTPKSATSNNNLPTIRDYNAESIFNNEKPELYVEDFPDIEYAIEYCFDFRTDKRVLNLYDDIVSNYRIKQNPNLGRKDSFHRTILDILEVRIKTGKDISSLIG